MKHLAYKISSSKVDLTDKDIKSYFEIVNAIYVAACLIIFLTTMNKLVISNQGIYGIFLYTLLLIDGTKDYLMRNENARKTEILRRDDIIKAMLKTFTLLIIPVLTLNQSLVTRLPYFYMMTCASIPALYLILLLFASSLTSQDNMFARCLTISIVLNSLASLKTTYYGLAASLSLLFNQYYRNHGCLYREMVTKLLTVSFIDFTLSALAVYK